MSPATAKRLAWVLAIAAAAVVFMAHERLSAPSNADWPGHGGSADESGFSSLDEIDAANAGKLGLDWSLDLDGEATLQGTPLAVDGVLYFTGSMSKAYAVDGVTGEVLWTYDPETWRYEDRMHFFPPVNRGPAFDNGKLFISTLDGRLIALDSRSGTPIWSVQTLKPGTPQMVTGAPRTFRGKVIIGNGGGDFGARGYVTAYDQASGKLAWRFYTVPGSPAENRGDPAMEAAAKTWNGEYWKTGTGGTAWNGITFDAELNRIYIGTGNSGPYNPRLRSPGGGDNLYLASIVAVDADTGKYLWHYQVNPSEAWDYKATTNMIAATLDIDGNPTKVLMQAPTNGFFYVLNRNTGKLISAEKIGKVTWAKGIDLKTGRPIEYPDIRYEKGETRIWPGNLGAHNWQDMAFSPQTGLVYIPAMQLGSLFTTRAGPNQVEAAGVVSQPLIEDDRDGTGELLAWDPVEQKARWRVPYQEMWNGGPMATAGGLVFQGTAAGNLVAYDARNGRQVWHFNTGLGIISRPISYSAGGKQRISVLVGFGGNAFAPEVTDAGWKYGQQTRRLLTFVLGGRAKLPPGAPRDFVLHPVDNPDYQVVEADLLEGHRLFTFNCAMCHGVGARSGNAVAPDLRESAIALAADDVWTVVHEGVLRQRGMPRFAELTRPESDKIYNYIRAMSREALGKRRPRAFPALKFGS